MARPIQVVIDGQDPAGLARFWAEALGYRVQPPPPGFTSWDDFLSAQRVPPQRWNDASAVVDPDGRGPRLYFQRVPEPKQVKNRVHLDVTVTERETPAEERRQRIAEEVERLRSLGAKVVRADVTNEFGDHWTVMQDPEGNEFCVQ